MLMISNNLQIHCSKGGITIGGHTTALKYLYVVAHVLFYNVHMWKQLLSQDEVKLIPDNCDDIIIGYGIRELNPTLTKYHSQKMNLLMS